MAGPYVRGHTWQLMMASATPVSLTADHWELTRYQCSWWTPVVHTWLTSYGDVRLVVPLFHPQSNAHRQW
jgi:hypothetical protein